MEKRDYFVRAVEVLARDAGYTITDKGDFVVIEMDNVDDNTIKDIVDYLNKKSGKSFSWETKPTQTKIKKLIRKGYQTDEFKMVIDHKVSQWGSDSRMKEYIRPDTLFNSKFESYINAARQTSNTTTMYDLLKDDWDE